MMPSTNGHGPQKRAILYTRVSGNEQRDHGYSLSDQKRELKEWVAKEGSEVLEEVEDGAWSGGFLERPGLDRVRERVTAGGVDAVVVLFRDRIASACSEGVIGNELSSQCEKPHLGLFCNVERVYAAFSCLHYEHSSITEKVP